MRHEEENRMPELILPLRRRGALVKILVRGATQASHRGIPRVGPLLAYLDTGASDTMLDVGVIEPMRLEPIRSAALNVLGREDVSFHETYEIEVALILPDEPPCWIPLTVLAGAVYPTGAVAALGRDFLYHVEFTYDGPKKRAIVRW
jgi:hypothetical protein